MALPVAGYTSPYQAPWFTGSPVSSDQVPGTFHVAIGGHPYMIDFSHRSLDTIAGWFREETLPLLRQQSDDSAEPGEQSISPEPFWRRSQETWHKGAGQTHLDRRESDRARFRTSKGVDIWTKWELSLLEDTQLVDPFSGGSGSQVVVIGDRAYAASGANGHLRTAADPLMTWADVAGAPATGCTSLTHDGVNVYAAFGASGLYVVDTSVDVDTAAQGVTGSITKVAYLKGRLIAADGPELYEIGEVNTTTPPSKPTAFYTHPNPKWQWVGCAEGDEFIYAAGNAGGLANVYKIALSAETTELAPPTSAMSGLPVGETIYSIHGAFGFVFLGTSRGVRFCTVTDSGDLLVGALIETGSPVRGFTTWDRFTYFTWSDFDLTSSGLGRLDPTVINDGLVPAYASDVMASGTGVVNAVAILPGADGHGHPVFTIDGSGVWRCTSGKPVPSGELRTGLLSYGIADQKIATFLDIRHEPLPLDTSISAALVGDDGMEVPVGRSRVPGSIGPGPLSGQQRRAEMFEVVFTLNSDPNQNSAPSLRRWTLRVIPAPRRTRSWTIPLNFRETLAASFDREYPFDPGKELEYLRTLHATQEVVLLQLLDRAFQVVVSDYTFPADRVTEESVPSLVLTGPLFITVTEVAG